MAQQKTVHCRSSQPKFTSHKFICPLHSSRDRDARFHSHRLSCRRNGRRSAALQVWGLDAAQPFDFESKMEEKFRKENLLKIGIVGFGNFGQFLAKRLVKQGHDVIATSRTSYLKEATEIGVKYFEDANDFCENHPDVVVISTSIISLEVVLKNFPMQRLRRSTLIVDVASVKVFPRHAMLRILPPEVDILCTHPMFGPDSGGESWEGLKFMYECVRINDGRSRQKRLNLFLECFASEGCEMVNMTCEEHDRLAAGTQFITHTVGRILGMMDLKKTNIDTKGFQSLLSLVENTTFDSFDLYYGLFMYNPNAPQELARLESAFDEVKTGLFDNLHSRVRAQLFPGVSFDSIEEESDALSKAEESSASSTANPSVSSSNGTTSFDNIAPLRKEISMSDSKSGSQNGAYFKEQDDKMLPDRSKDIL